MALTFCDGPGCNRPTVRCVDITGEGTLRLCSAHQRQWTRNRRLEPIEKPLTPKQRALEAGLRLLECDSDDDAEFERLEKAFVSACKVFGKTELKRAPASNLVPAPAAVSAA